VKPLSRNRAQLQALLSDARSDDTDLRTRSLDALERLVLDAQDHTPPPAQEAVERLSYVELQRIVDGVEEGLAVLDRDAGVADQRSAWTVRYANERMRRLGGRAAVRGSVTFDALVRLADAQDLFVALDEAHTIGAPSRWQGCEPQEDGQALWLEADLVPLQGEAGAPPPMLVVMRNITERKRVEERLVSQAELLERRNAELRDFAWTASHDLRAPLRKIRAFIERLTESAGQRLDPTERDFLARMHRSADALERRIEAMLAFSRISGRSLVFGPADLGALVRETLSALEPMIEQTEAEIVVGALPVVHSDAALLAVVLQNLLSNALKYRKREVPPRVRIDAAPVPGGRWNIEVADNGLGFDPTDGERIFAPFERLHAHLGEDGTGVGLALARRLAERLGGTLVATGRRDEGATFTLTLPADLTRG
jgi:signal transduction histidine kinase